MGTAFLLNGWRWQRDQDGGSDGGLLGEGRCVWAAEAAGVPELRCHANLIRADISANPPGQQAARKVT